VSYGTAGVTITPSTGFTPLPGLALTVNVPNGSKALISTNGGFQTTSTSSNGFSLIDIWILINGTTFQHGSLPRLIAANNAGISQVFAYWSTTTAQTLPPGTHTIAVYARGLGSGSNAVVSGDTNSVLQGELSVTLVKQ
jgi:hypothetical protein